MKPTQAAAGVTDEAFEALRRHPGFRAACEMAVADSIVHYRRAEPDIQWITKDIGRSSIWLSALILECLGELTVQNLTTMSVANRLSSSGRVTQFVRRCQDFDLFRVEDGAGLWTRRPARLGQRMTQSSRDRALVDLQAALTLAPEMAPVAELVATDAGFASYVVALAQISQATQPLFGFERGTPLNYFLDREGGMLMVFDLLGAQAPGRARLLEEAPISRYALSRAYGVSRAHINKMLAESGGTEARGDRVVFSAEMSDLLERHMAVVFVLNLAIARSLAGGWRFRSPPRQPVDAASA
jgi:hypothetical protein